MGLLTKIDPDGALDLYCLHCQNAALATGATYKMADGKRVDIGIYDYVMIVVGNAGGTATGTLVVTPRESDSQTGPEFALDGTNGAPDFSMTFTTGVSASTNASHQRVMRVRDRRQFLNVLVSTVNGVGTWRPIIYLVGLGKRSNTARLLDTDLALIGGVV